MQVAHGAPVGWPADLLAADASFFRSLEDELAFGPTGRIFKFATRGLSHCMEGEEQLEERDASELVPFWIRLGLALPEPTAFEAR
jgi:hypothetical protein